MKTPSLEQFKAWARANHDLAMEVVTAQAYAQTMREAVDKIQRQILKDVALYNDLETKHSKPRERISDPKLTYLSEDDPAVQRYFAECNKRERAAGLKPADMPDEYCPALVAEHEQIELERKLLDSGGALFGFGAGGLVSGDLWQRGLHLMIGGALRAREEEQSHQRTSTPRSTQARPKKQSPPRLSR